MGICCLCVPLHVCMCVFCNLCVCVTVCVYVYFAMRVYFAMCVLCIDIHILPLLCVCISCVCERVWLNLNVKIHVCLWSGCWYGKNRNECVHFFYPCIRTSCLQFLFTFTEKKFNYHFYSFQIPHLLTVPLASPSHHYEALWHWVCSPLDTNRPTAADVSCCALHLHLSIHGIWSLVLLHLYAVHVILLGDLTVLPLVLARQNDICTGWPQVIEISFVFIYSFKHISE